MVLQNESKYLGFFDKLGNILRIKPKKKYYSILIFYLVLIIIEKMVSLLTDIPMAITGLSFIMLLASPSIMYFYNHFKSIKKGILSISKSKISWKYIIITFFIVLILWSLPQFPIGIKVVISILWFISGIARTIVEKSPALIYWDKKDIVPLYGFYGHTRATYFISILVFSLSLGSYTGVLFFDIFNIIFCLFFTFLLVKPLTPYISQSEDVWKTIRILRVVSKYDKIKVNQIVQEISQNRGFKEEYVRNRIYLLSDAPSYFQITPNKRIIISPELQSLRQS